MPFDLANPSHANNEFEFAMSRNVKHLEFYFLSSSEPSYPYREINNISRYYFFSNFTLKGSMGSCYES